MIKTNPHNYYDEISKGYDELHSTEQIRKLKIIKNNVCFKKSDFVLDIGGGTGISVDVINSKITNVEPSKKMLELGLNKRKYEAINAPAEKIFDLFKNDTFDKTICVTVAHHFQDLKKVVLGIKKSNKKNADIIFSLLKKSIKTEKIKKTLLKEFVFIKQINDETDVLLFFKNKK